MPHSARPYHAPLVTTFAVFAGMAMPVQAFADEPQQPPVRVRITDFTDFTIPLTHKKSSLVQDVNRDGVVTDIDILLTVYDKSTAQPLTDLDGDGSITAADLILAIRQMVVTSLADPNADDVITTDDAIMVLNEMVKAQPDLKIGDVDGNGIVDGADLTVVWQKMELQDPSGGTPLNDWSLETAQAIHEQLGWAVQYGIDALRVVVADKHLPIISDGWDTLPGVVPSHTKAISRDAWPGNHEITISQEWKPSGVNPPEPHLLRTSAMWKPNHSRRTSRSWQDPMINHLADVSVIIRHESALSWQIAPNGEHVVARSNSWPSPNHSGLLSRMWPDTHSPTVSRLWPPNHLTAASTGSRPRYPEHNNVITLMYPAEHQEHTHQREHSRIWPPTHLANYSARWPGPNFHSVEQSTSFPPNHIGAFSDSWGTPSNHSISLSRTYPPNHLKNMSLTFGDHFVRLSIFWPANHHGSVSGTWDVPPPSYPANHLVETSRQWYLPSQPWWNPPNRVFPGDHSWFTTIQSLVPFVPSLPSLPGQPRQPNP